MAVNYSAALKSTRMQAVIAAIDANASPAYIEFGDSGFSTLLCTITLSDPSFSESGGVITMLGTPKSGTAAASGTTVVARIKDGGGNIIVNNLSVGVSASDINLSSNAITSGNPVTLTSGTLAHSA